MSRRRHRIVGARLGVAVRNVRLHPGVQLALKLLRVTSAGELAMVFASVGLAQHFAAIHALGSIGIQKGHMALHARCVAATAGAQRRKVGRIR